MRGNKSENMAAPSTGLYNNSELVRKKKRMGKNLKLPVNQGTPSLYFNCDLLSRVVKNILFHSQWYVVEVKIYEITSQWWVSS